LKVLSIRRCNLYFPSWQPW